MITALVVLGALTGCSSDDNKDAAAYEGTWIADDLSYKFGDNTMNHKFIEMPGDDYAVFDNDKLVLTADKATLYEYKKSVGSETVLKGSIKDNVITFEDEKYTTRTIVGVQNNRLTVVYDITMRGFTLPVTVIYNKK